MAGPIERATSLLGQLAQERRFDAAQAAEGARQMLYGYLLKLVLADNLAPLVDAAWRAPAQTSPWAASAAISVTRAKARPAMSQAVSILAISAADFTIRN